MRALSPTRLGLGLGGLAFALYAATLHPGVGGIVNHGDSAKFQFLGVVPGIGHAPGNPLYLLLLSAVQRVPFGTAAVRANLLSALLSALTVAFVASASARLAGPRAAGLAALSLALGGLSWEFATEAEVYALSGLMVALIVEGLARAEVEARPAGLALAGGAFLLGLANHLSLVLAAPGLLSAGALLMRQRVRPGPREWLTCGLCGVATALLYGGLPALDRISAYSEYPSGTGLDGFLAFVSGRRWHAQVGIGSLKDALEGRSLLVMKALLSQWVLPLWLCVPLAFAVLFRCARAVALFGAAAGIAWATFLFVYDIPDAQGLVVPLAVCVAPALGVAAARARFATAAAVALTLSLLPTAVYHLRHRHKSVGFEVLEDVVRPRGRELLDLPDIIARIPRGAFLTMPCHHYGCAQVTNYFRFADAPARARGIEIVMLKGGATSHWNSSPPVLDPRRAQGRVVCTIHAQEVKLLKRLGARVTPVERPARRVAGKLRTPLPVYCGWL